LRRKKLPAVPAGGNGAADVATKAT
jgi:hypothetical protein